MLVILGFAMILAFMALIMTQAPHADGRPHRRADDLRAVRRRGPRHRRHGARVHRQPRADRGPAPVRHHVLRHHDRRRAVRPAIRFITRLLGNDPAKVVLGTALLAGAVSLDGDGSTTFIITTSAMLPIYLRLGMSPVVLTCVAGLMNGALNIVPWGGPTVRAASALRIAPTEIFVPMLPSLAVGLAVSLCFAWMLGLGERKRLGSLATSEFMMNEWAESGRMPLRCRRQRRRHPCSLRADARRPGLGRSASNAVDVERHDDQRARRPGDTADRRRGRA